MISMKTRRNTQKTLSSGEEIELAARIQAGHNDDGTLTPDATNARNFLVESNLGLVYSQTNLWYKINPKIVEDLEQVGLVKLVELASTFDPELGRFSTHAFSQIGWCLGRYADAQRSSIRVPVERCKADRELRLAGVWPQALPEEKPPLRLDVQSVFTAIHPIVHAPEVNEAAAEKVAMLLETSGLTPRQKRVIGLVFGITTQPRFTQEEAAKLMGISQPAVSQLIKKALVKMKNSQSYFDTVMAA